MQDYQISIIVPCYNSQDFIAATLESVLEQSYLNWECILVNDGSQDKTEEELKKWVKKDNRFKYYYQENKGLSGARNAGLKLAKGEFIYFLDADDLLAENTINSLLDLVTDSVDIVVGKSGIVKRQNRDVIKVMSHKPEVKKVYENNSKSLLKLVLEEPIVCAAWNKLYRKSFINKNNLSFKEGLVHEDELWFFETLFYTKAIILNDSITYYYNIGNSNSITHEFKSSNVNAYLDIVNTIHKKYYLKSLNEPFFDLISVYLTHLKTMTILYCYNKLPKKEKNKVVNKIENTFKQINLKRNKKVLNKRLEKRFYRFELLEVLPINFVLSFFIRKTKIKFIYRIRRHFIKIAAILIRFFTKKTIRKKF